MPITHVGAVSTLVLNTTSVNLDLAAVAWQPGDLALIRCGAVRVFDVPAGWTQDLFLQPGGLTRYQGFWRVLQAGDPDVWALTLSAGEVRNITAGITVHRGVDQTTPIDVQGNQAGEVAPSVVTTVADAAVLRTWFGLNSGSAFTAPGGVTQRWNEFSATSSAVDMAHADAAQPVAGASGTATAAVTTPSNTWAATTALTPAAGGGETTAEPFSLAVGFGAPTVQADFETAAEPLAVGLAFGPPQAAAVFRTTAEPFVVAVTFGENGIDMAPALPLPAVATVLPDLTVATELDLAIGTDLPDLAVLTDLPALAVLTTVEG